MPHQKYENKTIASTIEEINIRYFLPDIQRSYVWKKEQIYALYDSILRGYPISTFLFWETKAKNIDKLTPRFEFPSANKKEYQDKINTSKGKEFYSLVIDGQQRLTSLFLTLKGNFIINDKYMDLYLNILSGEEEDKNGNIFEFNFFSKDKEDIFYKENKYWASVKYIYSFEEPYDVPVKLNDEALKKYDYQITDNSKKYLMTLWTKLKYDDIINYYPVKENDLNKVLDIFIRINGGTKLSKSDLLFSTIKRHWGEAREEFKKLLKKINKVDRYKFNHDFILKTCLVLFGESQNHIKYNVSNIKNGNLIEDIKSNWTNISRAIDIVVDELDKYKLASNKVISSYNALIPLIYFIYKNSLKTSSLDNNSSLMQKWLIKILLNGIFGGQADTMLYISKKAIDNEVIQNIFPYAEINQQIIHSKKSFNSIRDILENPKLKYNSSDSFLILSLLYPNANFNALYSGNLPQQDHIFSQSELSKNNISNEQINSIFNIQYLDAYLNQIKSNKDFNEWIIEISEEKKEKYLIPSGEWGLNNYENFLNKRKELFLEKLETILEK